MVETQRNTKDRDSNAERRIEDERAPLLGSEGEQSLYQSLSRGSHAEIILPDDADVQLPKDSPESTRARPGVYFTISVLFLGVFVCNIDASLILATYGKISSEFDDFDSGSWLVSSFVLAQCVVQPLYGKLSDIYGRKAVLQSAYILFTVGTVGLWFGQSMGQAIASRVIQGAGSAGMTSLVSIIITDLVPIHEVAVLRSYVNILATTGRSCGGAIGGALTQMLGWRWAFGVQVPFTVIAIVLVQWRLHITPRNDDEQTRWQKLKRVDFIGAALLCSSIFAFCFVMETGGQRYAWKSPVIITMAVICGITALAFGVSTRYVPESIFPLRLACHYAVWTNYLIGALQVMTQFSLCLVVPLYFQTTAKASEAAAGAYLIPAFIGNMLGGLLSGYWIKHTGLYKPPTLLAPILSIGALTICYTVWNGRTTVLESLAILPGGMAAGMVSSSTFVGLAAGVSQEHIAMAGSGLYLAMNVGSIVGLSAVASAWQISLKSGLESALNGVENNTEIIDRALSDISYVQNASESIRRLIVPAFVKSFHSAILLEFGWIALCLLIAIVSPQQRLKS